MRDAVINLRALPEQCDLIDYAANLLGKSRSDFMLEAACERVQPLAPTHRLDDFGCGVADPDQRGFGYYAMAPGAVSHQTATSAARLKMPDPIPMLVLARLAVDRRAQDLKLGGAMLQDTVNLAVTVSQNVGVRALLVHALHDHAKLFYEHYGFQALTLHPTTLMPRLRTVKA